MQLCLRLPLPTSKTEGRETNSSLCMLRKPVKKTPSLFDNIEESAQETPGFVERVVDRPQAASFVDLLRPDFSSGEKSKARDILAAIRTLHLVEKEKRRATPEEREILARFCGFGPVALSVFPNP